MGTPTDVELSDMLQQAHSVKNALLRPVEERQSAALAISHTIMVAAEYRAQRDTLRGLLREASALMPLGTKKRADWLRRASALLPTEVQENNAS